MQGYPRITTSGQRATTTYDPETQPWSSIPDPSIAAAFLDLFFLAFGSRREPIPNPRRRIGCAGSVLMTYVDLGHGIETFLPRQRQRCVGRQPGTGNALLSNRLNVCQRTLPNAAARPGGPTTTYVVAQSPFVTMPDIAGIGLSLGGICLHLRPPGSRANCGSVWVLALLVLPIKTFFFPHGVDHHQLGDPFCALASSAQLSVRVEEHHNPQ